MSFKTRLEKLEQRLNPCDFAIIAVDNDETDEQAYQRCFADGIKPKQVIYASHLDVLL